MVERGCTGTLKIRRRDNSTTTIKLPYIKSIVTSVTASLTEISTIIYGYRNNFCMDLGTSQTISLKLERVNPIDYNDRSTDPEMWSNGKWYRWFEDQLTSGRTSGGTMTTEPSWGDSSWSSSLPIQSCTRRPDTTYSCLEAST